MYKEKKLAYLLFSVLIAVIAVLAGILIKSNQKPQSFECTNYAMGTYVQQTVYGKNGQQAAKAAAQKIGELENLISWRHSDSDVTKLNQASGSDWVSIDPKTAEILQKSLDVADKSYGAFDPTILPVSSLWDFGGENQHLPSKEEIQKYLKYVNYQELRVDTQESTASLKRHYMAVDLGAVGKGAACDEAVAAYKQAGAESGIIAVGGSVGVFGTKKDGTPWNIAVRDPHSSETQSTSLGAIDLRSGYVSTSGTYEKHFTKDGVTYHHLLNPKTGYPENNGLVSVTVVCDNGALSDALSTACFVLGREKGAELLKEFNAGGIFITTDNKIYLTKNMENTFTLSDRKYSLIKSGV
ncbi:MAG: FAD:protein FMN transferase [Eubacteriales bacterium]|jgi:FAD:protein FMN transferase